MEINRNFDIISAFKNGRSNFVKILWTVVLFFSFFGLIYYIRECYVKLKVTPEILISERLINSRGIPFPAVTICPPFGIKKEFFEMEEDEKIKMKIDNGILNALSTHFCYTFDALSSTSSLSLKRFNTNLVELFDKLSPQINDFLNICTVTGYTNYFGCDEIYTRTLTTFGYCFTFNMLNFSSVFQESISDDFKSYKQINPKNLWIKREDSELLKSNETPKIDTWRLHNGYTINDEFVKPLRASKTNRIFTDTREQFHEDFVICEDIYKIIFHLPNEVPSSLDLSTNIEFDTAKILLLNARVLKHDESLKQFPPDQRGCYFEGERELKFFKTYTKNNCEHECMINYTLSKCGCVKFTMPRTNDMKVCDFDDIHCHFLIFKEWSGSFYEDKENQKLYPDYPCNCMPYCTQIRYELTEKETDRTFKGDESSFISLVIKFENHQIVMTTHYVPYKLQNFISDVGGLVGLFLGFSLLSLFEMILNIFAFMIKMFKKVFHSDENESESEGIDQICIISGRKEASLIVVDLEDLN